MFHFRMTMMIFVVTNMPWQRRRIAEIKIKDVDKKVNSSMPAKVRGQQAIFELLRNKT